MKRVRIPNTKLELHDHPNMEEQKGIDKGHVIIDRDVFDYLITNIHTPEKMLIEEIKALQPNEKVIYKSKIWTVKQINLVRYNGNKYTLDLFSDESGYEYGVATDKVKLKIGNYKRDCNTCVATTMINGFERCNDCKDYSEYKFMDEESKKVE